MRAPLLRIGDAGRQPGGMQTEPQQIHGFTHQHRVGAGNHPPEGWVGRDHAPVPVHRQSRIGFVSRQHRVDPRARSNQGRVRQRTFLERRGESGRCQQQVALAQRDFQPFRDPQDDIACRWRPAGFETAQIRGGDVCRTGKVDLAHASALAPFTQEVAHGLNGRHHEATVIPQPHVESH